MFIILPPVYYGPLCCYCKISVCFRVGLVEILLKMDPVETVTPEVELLQGDDRLEPSESYQTALFSD